MCEPSNLTVSGSAEGLFAIPGNSTGLELSLVFMLALAVPFGLLLVFVAVPGLSEGVVGVLTQVSQVAGLVAILYALWM